LAIGSPSFGTGSLVKS